ncbi:MAG: T9SS type A sorting domain-containing protein [Chitinophagaceae bacterium]
MQSPYLKNRWDNKKTSAPFFEQRIVEGDSIIVSIRTMQVNVNDAASNIVDDAANEPSIAIDINDTLHIAIGWRQFDNIASNFRQAGWSYSSDGGLTWNMSIIDEGVFRSDPVLDYDLQGNFYYNSLTPYPDWECDVYKSTNGGATWDEGTYAYGGDKQWMAIDRTNGEGSGNIYAIWSADYSACVPGNFTRSTDGNLSYESCEHVEAEPYYGMPAVDADGYLYVVGGGGVSTLTVTRSLNAQIPGATIEWDDPVNVDLDGSLSGWQDINPEGLIGQANIDIDRSGGPGHGNIYVLAPVDPYTGPDDADISFAKSTDGGLTWSDPIWINDEKNDGNTHWFGTMSVAPNGRIDVIWLDTRDGGGVDYSALYYCYSVDQGETWSANMKLSPSFDPHVGYPSQNKMGDYFDMTSDDKGAHLAWANTLNGEEDVYYSRILLTEAAIVNIDATTVASIAITPNPGSGIFHISGVVDANEITVVNLVGDIIMTQAVTSSQASIDITNFADGIYFIKIAFGDGRYYTKRFIKQ